MLAAGITAVLIALAGIAQAAIALSNGPAPQPIPVRVKRR